MVGAGVRYRRRRARTASQSRVRTRSESAGAWRRAPIFLDAAVAPDEQGAEPGEEEHGDDDQAGRFEVEAGREAPEAVVEALAVRPLRTVRREGVVKGSRPKRSWKIWVLRKVLGIQVPKSLH